MSASILYEVNTRVWLRELSEKTGQPMTLANIPEGELERWKQLGFTHIWLMGVWTIGPLVREEALKQWRTAWSKEIASSEDDVQGSPYAIKDYSIDPRIGNPLEMLLLRDQLRQHGLKLILDFIPNHLGIDSEEPHNYPAHFVQSPHRVPGTFERKTKFGKRFFAHGRDPYFPPWADTVQLDYRVPETHTARTAVAQTVVVYCDGLRCDMAMLLIPEIFEKTWQDFPPSTHQPTGRNFWKSAIGHMKQMNPGADLIAEAYWGREQELQDAGFDFTYNKRVTDMLLRREYAELQEFLLGCKPEYLSKSIHFLENHDEQRIASVLPLERHKVAALLMMALPGMPLLHDGQLEGRKAFARIQMSKRPPEQPDSDLQFYYERLLLALQNTQIRKGRAEILQPAAAEPGDATQKKLIIIKWTGANQLFTLVLINLGEQRARFTLEDGNLASTGLQGTAKMVFSTNGSSGLPAQTAENRLLFEIEGETGQIFSYEVPS
jgi:glycosidase